MKAYYEMLNDILEQGEDRGDRTGVGTRSLFGVQKRYRDVGNQFPLDTTREINFASIVHELLWMLRGETNIRSLVKEGVNIWTDWPHKNYTKNNPTEPLTRTQFNQRIIQDDVFAAMWGNCGPVYGKQWRAWDDKGRAVKNVDEIPDDVHAWTNLGARGAGIRYDGSIDQIANLVADLKKNPLSRRHIVSAWNVADIPEMIPSGLPPCHVMFQFYCSELNVAQRFSLIDPTAVINPNPDLQPHHGEFDALGTPKYRLHCQLYQRSLDSVLGGPYNIAAYSLLTMMLAQQCNMVPGDFIHSVGDAHIYNDHREKLEHQLARRPYDAPTVKIRRAKDIFSYTIDDFTLHGYEYHPAIRYPIAV